MCSLPRERIETAYFISPIVDMEKLICDMMCRAGVSEREARRARRKQPPGTPRLRSC